MGGVQACPGGLCGSNELRLVAVAQFLTDFHLERATGCPTLPSVGFVVVRWRSGGLGHTKRFSERLGCVWEFGGSFTSFCGVFGVRGGSQLTFGALIQGQVACNVLHESPRAASSVE